MNSSFSLDSSPSQLAVFARYPEAGKCKTRLIPALGEEGASALHREMTERTLQWAAELHKQNSVRVAVHTSGATPELFRKTFGLQESWGCQSQVEGDLGDKLMAVAEEALHQGFVKLLFVGTDCPQIDERIAKLMLRRLQDQDVCFVPAADGGYALLGLNLPRLNSHGWGAVCMALFKTVDWGTDSVFETTVKQLLNAGVSKIGLQPALHDVDLPEDLGIWEQAKDYDRAQANRISVVVPCRGAERRLEFALRSAEGAEKLVVGSDVQSETLLACRDRGAHFLTLDGTRAEKMNRGAAEAGSENLLFLHADSELPDGFDDQACALLTQEGCVAGAFSLRIDSDARLARWVEFGVRLRCRLQGLPYGDQGIFVKQPMFQVAGGFPEQPIMEDYEFVKRVKRLGRVLVGDGFIKTSARRWEKLGFWRTTWINQWMIVAYWFGVPVEQLAEFYRRKR
ncbi:MAG: TIGR04283 family arsenosugar biosynthesis glycosyltransferase [Planctomycetota bacterium]|nr:TIGR04283 family arsenosugar biosynthesis glycosyltransferase [Planctomycetota bacterium]